MYNFQLCYHYHYFYYYYLFAANSAFLDCNILNSAKTSLVPFFSRGGGGETVSSY